jgi:hypothetical protein
LVPMFNHHFLLPWWLDTQSERHVLPSEGHVLPSTSTPVSW